MDGYVLLSPAATKAAQTTLARNGWTKARATSSAALFVRPYTPVRDFGSAWIVGDLYPRGAPGPAPAVLEPKTTTASPEAVVEALLSGWWGRYVALFPHEAAAFRDPSGHIDCFTWRLADGWAAASEPPDALPLEAWPLDLAIDWDGLAGAIEDPFASGMTTGLRGLSPLAPGGLRRLGASGPDRQMWRPATFAGRPHASYEASRDAVRSAVREVLQAEASHGGPLLAEISGGVDSAIVATTLASIGASERTRFINFHIADPTGDERPFARAVANQAKIGLEEIAKPELWLDAGALGALPVGFRPSLNGIDRHYDGGVAEQAMLAGAGRILTGQGGDMVFFQAPSPKVIGELWGRWTRRPRADPLWRQLEDAARWNRRSVWSLLGEAIRDAARPSATGAFRHPWLEEALAPAKRAQVRMLARSQAFHGASLRGRQTRLIHPLLHQPVLEAILATPVVDLARHGRGRFLARDAFGDQLPAVVGNRRSKGDLTAYYGRMVVRSLSALTPFLLDGRLVQQRLVDRAALETLFDPDRLIYQGDYPRLFEIIALEAFVRHWEGRLGSLAAASAGRERRAANHGRTSA